MAPNNKIIQGGQKRIAKNTVFLYLRLFLTIIISLYTSRVVLEKLGVDNYGIYNIVGSIVVSFIFINNALMSAMQRYFSYHIGKGTGCVITFSMSINILLILIIIAVILLETIGLWLFNDFLKIPLERHHAASVVYQITIITFIINFIRIPYQSLIIANEKMSVFAYFSIIEVLLKLFIVYMLIMFNYDKLILYAWLICGVAIINDIIYIIYCKIKFDDCNYKFNWNVSLFKEMLGFSSWNFIGGLSGALRNEGPNYLMNIFLGVQVNAGMGIAKQVSGMAYNFSSGFQTAFYPQIIKSYSSGEYEYLNQLIYRTTKISFFLIYIVAIPIIFCRDLFELWLTIVPPYAVSFCTWFLIAEIISSISAPLWMTAHAIGNIKRYQLILSLLNIGIIPIAVLILYLKAQPFWVIASLTIINLTILIYRIEYLTKRIQFVRSDYYKLVIKLLIIFPLITVPETWVISLFCTGYIGIIIIGLSSLIINAFAFYIIGLDTSERLYIKEYIASKLHFILK